MNFYSIKEARINANKKQSEIARKINISESYYSLIENGKRRPTIELAAKIANELNISLDEFFMLYNFTKCKDYKVV